MYRGTTPNLCFNIKSKLSLEDMAQIYVTLKSMTKEITYQKDDLIIDASNKRVIVAMSQEDTLTFKDKSVKAQIRLLSNSGKAYASDIVDVALNDVLKDGVISV